MNTRRLLLGLGLLLALLLAVFGDKTPNTSISEPVPLAIENMPKATQPGHFSTPTVASQEVRSGNTSTKQTASLEKQVVLQVKDRQQLIAHGKQAAGLFVSHSWAPPPKPVPQIISQPPAPTAPPLPFTYLGKQKEDGQWVVFLKRSNTTFFAKPNDVIDAVYRIESIAPPSMTLTYLPLNQPQTLLIE